MSGYSRAQLRLEKYIELFVAKIVDQSYKSDTQGGDIFDRETGKPIEIKAINLRNKSKSYSFQFHWLSENKIKKYENTECMYFVIRDGVAIKEIYKIKTAHIMPYLREKETGNKSISGHKSFSIKDMSKLKAKKIYGK